MAANLSWRVAGAERSTNMTFHDFNAVFNTSIHRMIVRLYILDADVELLAKLQEIVAFEFWRIIASQTRGLEAGNFQIFLQLLLLKGKVMKIIYFIEIGEKKLVLILIQSVILK